MSKIEAQEKTLKNYLSIDNNVLHIPYSQRPYEWKEKQVKRLFDDLVILNNPDVEIHMLNFFTLSKEDNKLSIFDGQQRTITTLLLIGAIANIAKKENFKKLGEEIINDYIKKTGSELEGNNDKFKILFDPVQEEAQNFLYDIIDNPDYSVNFDDLEPNSKNTIKAIDKNYHYLEKLIHEYLSMNDFNNLDEINRKKFIISLFNNIVDKTQLITIVTETDSLAMAMFETLNNTGKQLENFFVLKNDIISTLGEQNIKKIWENIEYFLDGMNYNKFLTAFTTILVGKVSKNNLLAKLYEKFDKNNTNEMKNLLMLMNDAAKNYRYIYYPETLYNTGDDNVSEFVEYSNSIDLFKVTQHFPILLAMFMSPSNYHLEDIITIQKAILALAICKFYFSEQRANNIEKLFANLAKKIYLKKIDISEILSDIKQEFPDGDTLKYRIEHFKVTKQFNKIKFLLRETYNYKYNKETSIKEDAKKIHYEHILPQTINDDSEWAELFTPEEHEEYCTSLGNGTLLLNSINTSIKNSSFNIKKEKYLESDITENKLLCQNNDIWDKSAIEQRSKNLTLDIMNYLNSLYNIYDI